MPKRSQKTFLLVEDDPNDALFVELELKNEAPEIQLHWVSDGWPWVEMHVSWVEMAGVSHSHQQVIDRRLNSNRRFSTTDNTGPTRTEQW